MLDTKVGAQEKAAPADVVADLKNKLQVALAKVTPSQVLAEQHRKMAEPGTAKV